MASPTDSARQATNITTAATSHAINVGSPAAGTLLIVFVRYATAPGAVTFTGYVPMLPGEGDASDASNDTTQIFYRLADGAEGATDTLSTTNSLKMGAICWEITGAATPNEQIPVLSPVAVGTTTANTCNPDAVTPVSVSQDFLFLVMGGEDGESGAFTGAPTNYVNLQAANSGTGGLPATNVLMGGASRQLTATGDNPGAFTHAAATTGWTAFTMAIFPTGYSRPFSGPATVYEQSVGRASLW